MNQRSSVPAGPLSADKAKARRALVDHLREGSLVLLVGSGISKDLGLPLWHQLVQTCASKAGIEVEEEFTEDTPAEELMAVVDQIKASFSGDKERYLRLVTDVLYAGVDLQLSNLQTEVLVTLGALVMQERGGGVSEIVTLNFDNLLEWYLRIHGCRVQVIVEPPSIERGADTRLFHFQGYLPHPETDGYPRGDIIFSLEDAYERAADLFNSWSLRLRQLLETKFLLAIGVSYRTFGDPFFRPLFKGLGTDLRDEGATGVWLFGDPITPKQRKKMIEYNIAPVVLPDHRAEREFLLSVCQRASGSL